MIYFILGRSGSGKTEYVYEKIQNLVKKNTMPVLIFPEQSSYMNEVRLLKQYGSSIASTMPIQSFTRLARQILSAKGDSEKKILDESSKAVLMSLAIENVKEHLELFANRSEKNDLATLFLRVISDYKTSSVTPEDIFDKMSDVSDERLRKKLKETALIYSSYESMVAQSFLDPDDDLTRMYHELLKENYFQNRTVMIDGFSGFTFQEIKILECIFKGSKDVYLTLGLEPLQTNEKVESVFATAEHTLKHLKNLCKKLNVPYKTVSLSEPRRYVSENLKAVERYIYRFGEKDTVLSDHTVSLFKAEDIYGEGEQLARQISKLVYEEKYTYSDIMIICRDIGTYAPVLEPIFSKYNIPYFLSYPQRLERKPLMRLIISAFDVVLSSFDTEAILVYLKTGLTDLKDREIAELENYVYMWNIRSKQWKEPFTMSPDGNEVVCSEEEKKKQDEKIVQIENLRQKVMKPLNNFSKALKKAEDGAAMAKAVYMLLHEIKASAQIHRLIFSLNELEQTILADEEIRLWDLMMDILDSLYNTTKGYIMTPRRFSDLLKLALSANDISDIPLTLDHVTVGTADRVRMNNPKAVFLLGAIEDIFPALPSENSFYTEAERSELQSLELLYSDTFEELNAKEKYFAYMAVTGATDKLYVSWYNQNSKGEQLEASSIVREIRKIIPDLQISTESQVSFNDKIWTQRQAMEVSASVWQEKTTLASTVRRHFKEQPQTASFASTLDAILLNNPYVITSKETAKKLFGSTLQLSASKIESYYLCPFKYFCQYGLKAKPREKVNVDARLFGNTVHFVLEKIISEQSMDKLIQSSEQEIDELVKTYLESYLEMLGGTAMHTERFVYLVEHIGKTLSIILSNLIAEFSQSDFRPADFELSMGGDEGMLSSYTLKLPTDEVVEISGKIDRVDTFVKDGKKYIRIIDYKTGNKTFSLAEVMYGLNMQMLLYLSALRSLGYERYSEGGHYELIPAGVLYMPSAIKYEQVENLSAFENSDMRTVLQKHNSNLKMNGLLIDDPAILNAMEKGCKGIFIPVKQKKSVKGDTSLTSNSLASLERFGKIFEYIDHKIMYMATQIYDGQIYAIPVKGKADACQYCPYQSVCGYEEGQPCHVMSKKMSKDDIERLLNETDEEEENNG